MATSKLELAVGTGQWDAGLKKAQAALNNFTQAQGGLQQALQKDSGDMQKFIQMMGKMDSTANTAKGQMNDYKRSVEQLTVAYNQMSDAQKASIGQDYLHTIDQLKSKFQAAKHEADELNRSLNDMSDAQMPSVGGGGSLFGGGKLSGMLQVFGGNVMTKVAGMGLSLAGELQDAVKHGIELAKQGEGIRIAFERLGRGDILQGLREATHGTVTDLELMKAAVKFNDFKLPLEELGTMLAFAQQKAKDTGQSVDYMVDSIVTGLGRKSLMILDNLGLSAAEIRDKMKETGDMTKAVGEIIREQMSKAGDYVETAADRAAQANVNLQNKMEELGRKFAPVQEASNNLWTSMKIGILDIVGGPLAKLLNGLTEAGRLKNALNGLNGETGSGNTTVDNQLNRLRGSNYKQFYYGRVVSGYNSRINSADAYIKQFEGNRSSINTVLQKAGKQFGQNFSSIYELKAYRDANVQMLDMFQKGSKGIMKPVKAEVKTDEAVKNVGELIKKLNELEEQRKKAVLAMDDEQVDVLTQQINKIKQNIGYLDPNALKTTSGKTTADKIGFDENKALLSGFRGVDTMPSVWQMMMENSKQAGLGDQGLRDMLGIGKQQEDLGRILKEYVKDPDSEKRKKEKKTDDDTKFIRDFNTVVSSVGNIASGLEVLGIELPEGLTKTIAAIQAISGILTAILTITTAIQATSAADATASIIDAIIPFARGGKVPHAASGYYVPGTRYSGDTTPILANAGELVLNKSSQSNLAAEIKNAESLVRMISIYQSSIIGRSQYGNESVIGAGGFGKNLQLETRFSAEEIEIILNNRCRRTGRGEILTTNFR